MYHQSQTPTINNIQKEAEYPPQVPTNKSFPVHSGESFPVPSPIISIHNLPAPKLNGSIHSNPAYIPSITHPWPETGHKPHLPSKFDAKPISENAPINQSNQLPSKEQLPTPPTLHNLNAPSVRDDSTTDSERSSRNTKSNSLLSSSSNGSKLATLVLDNEIPPEVKESFLKLVPFLREAKANNIPALLMETLKDWHQHMPLHEFYKFLFNNQHVDGEMALSEPDFGMSQNFNAEHKIKAFKLCDLVLKTFANPQSTASLLSGVPVENALLNYYNLHELRRTFLAIQIIFSSVRKADSGSSIHLSLSRLSVYKIYYILCHQLKQRYPHLLNDSSEGIILSHSRLGKLTKIVFPDLIQKRLGRRGESKYHYIGITWENAIVDVNMLKLLDLSIPELDELFRTSTKTNHSSTPPLNRNYTQTAMPISNKPMVRVTPVSNKPLHSFINLSSRFPISDCSPRIWTTATNKVPGLSQWATRAMKRSLDALSPFNLKLEYLVDTFNSAVLSDGTPEILSRTIFHAMLRLSSSSAQTEFYKHLYLVVFLLVLPVVVSSDEEVPVLYKVQFRESVTKCVIRLETDFSNVSTVDTATLSIFTRTLRKMLTLNEMTSCKSAAAYAEGVLKEMIHDLESAAACEADSLGDISLLEESYIQSIVIAMNAYNFSLPNDTAASRDSYEIETITRLSKLLKKIVMISKDKMSHIPEYDQRSGSTHMPHDVPFQIFKISTQLFHEATLADPLIVKFPIPVISFMMIHISNSMQYATFHDFGKRDPELSKETFKAWWIFSTMLQEYTDVISEVVSLSETLLEPSTP
ncbi:hypothetical protein JCM33374_g1285 [Metschnikowia sp. JCM 33374]|nr:hypothetical protein JCM33374_g1285 [Metschnikowia sp. JCM 33374]